MSSGLRLFGSLLVAAMFLVGSEYSDQQIQAAMQLGRSMKHQKMFQAIEKKRKGRINRAGPLDSVEKGIIVLTPLDRVALESSLAKQQMRAFTVDSARQIAAGDVTTIIFEAKVYNRNYKSNLPNWTSGSAHLVLQAGEEVIQPDSRRAGSSSGVAIGSRETGIVTQSGGLTTYTPLYASAIYEKYGRRAVYSFHLDGKPLPEMITVIAIGANGKRKEKNMPLSLFQ